LTAAENGRVDSGGLSWRTGIVWISFFGAMTLVTGLLALGDGGLRGGYLTAMQTATIGEPDVEDPIFQVRPKLDRERWKGIVIHDLGRPAGDAEFVHRLHLSYGYSGLGYHFLIGNGNGLGDGIIHVGYRWSEQKAGAHVARSAPNDRELNERTIGICLIGNGERMPFTDNQIQSLISLLRRLQVELDIPRDAIRLHSEVAPGVSSPGRFFPIGRVRSQLLD
jgi:hypothetical protein